MRALFRQASGFFFLDPCVAVACPLPVHFDRTASSMLFCIACLALDCPIYGGVADGALLQAGRRASAALADAALKRAAAAGGPHLWREKQA